MSRGPGRIERAIAAAFAAEPDNAFTTGELAERVYGGGRPIEKKHRVAILRAADNVIARDDRLDALRSESLGGELIYFDRTCLASYAMACMKRLHGAGRDEWIAERPRMTEGELRALLADRPEYRKQMAAGGGWRRQVDFWRAEREALRAGDAERLKAIRAEHEAYLDQVAAALRVRR